MSPYKPVLTCPEDIADEVSQLPPLQAMFSDDVSLNQLEIKTACSSSCKKKVKVCRRKISDSEDDEES